MRPPRTPTEFWRDIDKWQPWFAWYPVFLPTSDMRPKPKLAWLRTIVRRSTFTWDPELDAYCGYNEYEEPFHAALRQDSEKLSEVRWPESNPTR